MVLAAVLAELREYDTALIANTLGYIDPTPPEELYMGGSIRSVTASLGPTVGIAVTCEIDTSTPGAQSDMEGFWRQLEQIGSMETPAVWVVKATGVRPDHECIIGDGMAKLLHAAGCVGVVTDGGVRDVPGLLATPLAAYCRGTVIHHCALRVRMTNQPVSVGGITVHPADVIHANAEGVIKVPKAHLDVLAQKASRMRMAEQETHRCWRRTDLTLAEKRRWVQKVFADCGFGSAASAHELSDHQTD